MQLMGTSCLQLGFIDLPPCVGVVGGFSSPGKPRPPLSLADHHTSLAYKRSKNLSVLAGESDGMYAEYAGSKGDVDPMEAAYREAKAKAQKGTTSSGPAESRGHSRPGEGE